MIALIEAHALEVRRGDLPVLENVSLSLKPREIVTLVGPNGSGKSTLIKALVGAVPATSGQILRAPGLKIGYAPQKLAVDPGMPLTVRRFLNLPQRRADNDIAQALERTHISHLEDRQLSQLSGGQFQRVLLARAILGAPHVLILDEPTQGLDQPGSAAFYRLIEEIRDEIGCAVLLVSHELHVVMSASDRVICLNGHICCEGTPAVVTAAPAYRELFGSGTQGALALYRHDHDHDHDHAGGHGHDHEHHPHPAHETR